MPGQRGKLWPCSMIVLGAVHFIFVMGFNFSGCRKWEIAKIAMQSLIESSKPILQKAVTLDRENKRDEAVECYAEGITLLLQALSCGFFLSHGRFWLQSDFSICCIFLFGSCRLLVDFEI